MPKQRRGSRRQWNRRLPVVTLGEIQALARYLDLNEVDVVAVAVDRLAVEAQSGRVPWRDAEASEQAADIQTAADILASANAD